MGKKCKYGFPRLPLKETLIVDSKEFADDTEQDNELKDDLNKESPKNYFKIISDIEEILKDKEKMSQLLEIGADEEEYVDNKNKRIDALLKMAGDIKYEDYIMAIKKTRKRGSTALLERDITEIYINNYNPEWTLAWNANHDIQPVFDYFAVITYVTDYWAKPDEGLTALLTEAAQTIKDEPDQQKRCQQLANTFLSHRQMGEAEAYYKILPNLTLKYSSMDTVFIPADKKELRSKFLMKLDESDANYAKGALVKGGKEGKFIEKPDIIDKYCRRLISETSGLEHLKPIQFGKMYEPFRRKKDDDETEDKLDDKDNSSETFLQRKIYPQNI